MGFLIKREIAAFYEGQLCGVGDGVFKSATKR